MRLETQFTVGAPLDRAWTSLSDLGVLAACIPGAELHRADDVYTGRIKLDRNGDGAEWQATVRAVDRDEDEHASTIMVRARQLDGPAIGSATISSRCESAGDETRVVMSAEVVSSGYESPGEGLERAGRELLDKAAGMLGERATSAPEPPVSVPPPEAPREPAPAPAPASRLGLGRALALAGGALVAAAILRRLLGGRRGRHR